MAQRIVIRFPADQSHDYYTKVLNFAEALWGPIVNAGLGKLSDTNRASEIVWVEVSARRHLGTVKGIIRKTLERHLLAADAMITTE